MLQIKKYFEDWDGMRYFRLIAGLVIVIAAIVQLDWAIGFLGVFFLYQAIFNAACGCNTSCAVSKNPVDTKPERTENTI
ncbi:MAG: hypothetical protein HXX09_10180 [Bacteroidetes bacterium]|jgi:hypothetical protein|nr:hypothetical protein [Bacteroidota bacterium]